MKTSRELIAITVSPWLNGTRTMTIERDNGVYYSTISATGQTKKVSPISRRSMTIDSAIEKLGKTEQAKMTGLRAR